MKSTIKSVFVGSKEFGLDFLQMLCKIDRESLVAVMTTDDTKDSRSKFDEIKDYCNKQYLPCCFIEERLHDLILEFKPDIVWVVCWYWIIPQETLKLSKFIGVHHSPLPKYRGGAPLVWQIINGEPTVGSSLFRLTEECDDGPTYHQVKIPIDINDSIGDVKKVLESEMLQWIYYNYHDLVKGKIKPTPQDCNIEATFFSPRTPEDGLIDWNQPAQKIHDFIRAQSHPYPGAYTVVNGEKLVIWKAAYEPAC